MKKLSALICACLLSGCASMGSGLLEKTMLCDVEHANHGVTKGRLKDGALVQDYPEQGYFVYTITGINNANQTPLLVNGKGTFDGVEYTRTLNAYVISNKGTGNAIFITNCRKAY